MMPKWTIALLGLLACRSHAAENVSAACTVVPRAPAHPVAVTTPPLPPTQPYPQPTAVIARRTPQATIVWRILDHAFVEDDAGGAPHEMWVKLQVEIAGQVVGPFTLEEPGCTLGSQSPDPRVVSSLSCYWAGVGDYVEIHEKTPGEYVVTTYRQTEPYPDEPLPPKTNMRTRGTFHTTPPMPLGEALVAADGGAYSAY